MNALFAFLLLGAGVAAPAERQTEPKLYFCFAPILGAKLVFRGPVQPVGPIAERASYPKTFAKKLVAAGMLGSEDDEVFCVMRATEGEITKARESLVDYCPFEADGTMSPLCGSKWTVKDVLTVSSRAKRGTYLQSE